MSERIVKSKRNPTSKVEPKISTSESSDHDNDSLYRSDSGISCGKPGVRKGSYFEHDERTDCVTGSSSGAGQRKFAKETSPKTTRKTDNLSNSDKWAHDKFEELESSIKPIATEKWGHDKFNEVEQAPKTKDELVQTYGYDIRRGDKTQRNQPPKGDLHPRKERKPQPARKERGSKVSESSDDYSSLSQNKTRGFRGQARRYQKTNRSNVSKGNLYNGTKSKVVQGQPKADLVTGGFQEPICFLPSYEVESSSNPASSACYTPSVSPPLSDGSQGSFQVYAHDQGLVQEVDFSYPPPIPVEVFPIPITGLRHPCADHIHECDLYPVEGSSCKPIGLVPDHAQIFYQDVGVPEDDGFIQVIGGATYFDPLMQPPPTMRPELPPRPKAAIPIVDPDLMKEIEKPGRQ